MNAYRIRQIVAATVLATLAVAVLLPAATARHLSTVFGAVPAPVTQLYDTAQLNWRPDPYSGTAKVSSCRPFTYRVEASVPQKVTDTIPQAMEIIARETGLQPVLTTGPALLTITADRQDHFGDRPAAAETLTLASFEDGIPVIVEATMTFNVDLLPIADAGFDGDAPIGWTVVHEIGHVLGLDHNPDPTSLMAVKAHPMEKLSAEDRAALAAAGQGPCVK